MFHQNNRMGHKIKKNHRKNGKKEVRVDILPATWRHRHFPKAAEDSSIFRQFKIVFFITIAIEEIQILLCNIMIEKTHYKTKCCCGEKNQCWRRLNRARSPGGNFENYFWASSSSHLFTQHTQTTIVLTSKWRKRRPVAHRRIGDCCRDSSSFRPGLLPRCDAVHRDPDTRETEISSQR